MNVQPIFEPNNIKTPVYFHHIPKTAGQSLNKILSDCYGESNSYPHAERVRSRALAGEAISIKSDFVSAHMRFSDWQKISAADSYASITLLRDPWKRLVSHLNWVDRFNLKENHPALKRNKNPALKVLVKLMGDTDFDRQPDVEAFMRQRLPLKELYFDNLQVRSLITSKEQGNLVTPLAADAAAQAYGVLADFLGIGFLDDWDAFLNSLAVKLSIPSIKDAASTRENARHAEYRIHESNAILKDVLFPWIRFDYELIDLAMKGRR